MRRLVPLLLLAPVAHPIQDTRQRATEFPPALAPMTQLLPADPDSQRLSLEDGLADLVVLERALVQRMGLLEHSGEDWRLALDAVAHALEVAGPELRTQAAFAHSLQLVLARLGDAHTRVGAVSNFSVQEFSPFLVDETPEGVAAFHEDRSGLIDSAHPYLVAIDDLGLDAWLEIAAPFTPATSPHFVRRQTLRNLRYLGQLRATADHPANRAVRLTLRNADGDEVLRELALVTDHRPTYRPWPTGPSRILKGEPIIGYLRLPLMDGRPRALTQLRTAFASMRDSAGIVLDLRGNGGGTLAPLDVLLPALLDDERPALVAAAAVERVEEATAPAPVLASLGFRPAAGSDWSPVEQPVVDAFLESFQPEWSPAAPCSALQLLVVSAQDHPRTRRYSGSIAVLIDSNVFSACDVLVGALAQLPQVTFFGGTTGGGFGKPERIDLPGSRLHVIVSPLISYRPDGRLHVGAGQPSDVTLLPGASDLVGGSDRVLEAARKHLRKR